jgi:formate dehydrogenase beta subunit
MCASVKAARAPKLKGAARLSGPLGDYSLNLEGAPSCSEACPAGIDVKSYVNLIADKRYEEAVAVIRRANPFPGVCGRVCTHPCEAECERGDFDDPVAIKALKRFASDYERARRCPATEVKLDKKERVAIVGAGPAGLTAASDLARAGYPVVVYDSSKYAGGMLGWGIPSFRLPREIIRGEVLQISDLGVEIRLGETVENPAALLKKGFSAVVVAAGCMAPVPIGVDGEGFEGVLDCIDFLRGASEGDIKSLKGRTVVVGGGNAALDAARTALRLGSDVTIAYRRTEAEMPADKAEIAEAKEEGIKFEFLAIPKKVTAANGKVTGLEMQRARLGEPDASGRRAPVPIPDSAFSIGADWIIRSVGSKPEPKLLESGGLKLTKRGTIETSEKGETSLKGVFAAGDIVLGPATVVEAIGSGHDAAAGVISHLGGPAPAERTKNHERVYVVEKLPDAKTPRMNPPKAPAMARKSSFDEVEEALDELSAVAEASRCRRCGLCSDCDLCLSGCHHRQAVLIGDGLEPAWVKIPLDFSKKIVENHALRDGWKITADGKETAARLEPVQAIVDSDLCIACGLCDEACAYRAVRVRFGRSEPPSAVVDQAGCRACGACAGVCPTGAVYQGFMDDSRLFARVREAASESKGGIVTLSCIWQNAGRLAIKPADVPVICTRRVSPALVLEALASGASGVALAGCAEGGCHYLPGPWMGADMPEKVGKILESVGVDKRRVRYIETSGDCSKALKSFAGELKKAKLGPMPDSSRKLPEIRAPLGRAISLAHILMTRQDAMREKVRKAEFVLAVGCSPICDSAMEAHGISGSGKFLESVAELLDAAKIDCARDSRVLGPGSKVKKWGLDDLYEAYGKAAIQAVKAAKAKSVIAVSHEAFSKFNASWQKDFGKLGFDFVALPEILKMRLPKGAFENTPQKIAFHPACSGGNFSKELQGLLADVPGLKVAVVEAGCGETAWLEPNAENRTKAHLLLAKAEAAGARTLVVESHQCLTHLLASQAGWSEGSVKVTDVYSFLASRLAGVKTDE